jgi:hypothetical protein
MYINVLLAWSNSSVQKCVVFAAPLPSSIRRLHSTYSATSNGVYICTSVITVSSFTRTDAQVATISVERWYYRGPRLG